MNDRVALFVPSLGGPYGGGAERVMANLSSGLARRGLQVDLLLATDGGVYLPLLAQEVHVHEFRAKRLLMALPKLVRYLRAARPVALLTTLTYANIVALWAKRLAGVSTRVVIREATTLSRATHAARTFADRQNLRLARWFYPEAQAIVAVSDGVAEDLAREVRVPRERIHVLPNPIVTPELAELAASPVDHPWFTTNNGQPVVLAVGRLTAQKDFATLLRACAVVRARRRMRLLILGEGQKRQELQALAQELGFADDIDFPGFAANPFAYMARSTVFVLSSAWEGLPGVLIQAMASGARVVATDCESGPREILAGGRYGALVPVGDVRVLAEAIDDALARPQPPPPPDAWSRFTLDSAVDGYLRVLGLEA